MMPRRYRSMLALVLLPALLLACGLGKGTPAAETRVTVSPEAADRLEQKLKASVNPDDGAFSLEVTDVELTSYTVLKLTQQAGRAAEIPLEDFQVRLTGRQMILSGRLTTICALKLNVRVAASAQVEDGQLDVSLNEARVGAVSMPQWMLESLSRIVSETIVEAPLHLKEAVEIAEVDVGDGVIRLGGRVVKSDR
jgi:hypothetical protein